MPTVAVIGNGIYDAPGVRLRQAPFLAERVRSHGNLVTVDDEKRKFGLALEVAREVWGTA